MFKKAFRLLGINQISNLDAKFLDRVRRNYQATVFKEGDSISDIWSGIRKLQKPVHDALMANTNDRLHPIFADPIRSDLYYGVDNLSASVSTDAEQQDILCRDLLRRLFEFCKFGAPGASDLPWDHLDTALHQSVSFPNPFPGEMGTTTERGVVSFRAIQAIYQVLRARTIAKKERFSMIEIGPGMGRTAYYAYRTGLIDYTTIDLPMGVVAQACFLGATLGPDAIWLETDPDYLSEGRIKLLSNPPATSFDLVLNVDSMTEMPRDAAKAYSTWIAKHARCFLSINHDRNSFTVEQIASEKLTRLSRSDCPTWPGYIEEVYTRPN